MDFLAKNGLIKTKRYPTAHEIVFFGPLLELIKSSKKTA